MTSKWQDIAAKGCSESRRFATPKVLDQLLAGEPSIDVEDWRAHTLYKNCSQGDEEVKRFWEVLQSYSQSQLQALLAFVTCSPVPPAGAAHCLLTLPSAYVFCLSALPFTLLSTSHFCPCMVRL